MNPTLEALMQEITDAETVIDGATVFINGVPGLIQQAVQQALQGGATAAQVQPFVDLGATLKSKSDALNTAMVANTPPPAA